MQKVVRWEGHKKTLLPTNLCKGKNKISKEMIKMEDLFGIINDINKANGDLSELLSIMETVFFANEENCNLPVLNKLKLLIELGIELTGKQDSIIKNLFESCFKDEKKNPQFSKIVNMEAKEL